MLILFVFFMGALFFFPKPCFQKAFPIHPFYDLLLTFFSIPPYFKQFLASLSLWQVFGSPIPSTMRGRGAINTQITLHPYQIKILNKEI